MRKKLSVAIIGAGNIAGLYDMNKIKRDDGVYTHAGAYARSGRFAMKTICDISPEKAESFKKRWHFDFATSQVNDIYRGFHDVVSVCTPEDTHFEIIRNIIRKKAAKTIFAEKPLARRIEDIKKIIHLGEDNNINVVVNYQRRFDKSLERIRSAITKNKTNLLAVNAYYMKGLDHIGTTAIDTLNHLCGIPSHVFAYNRVFNLTVNEYSYEFILFYDDYNVTVKTIDSEKLGYTYHIFEIDLLFNDKRLTINDNSGNVEKKIIGDYAYSGVKVLDDRHSSNEDTGYRYSILETVNYIYSITQNRREHDLNTPKESYMNKVIVDAIIRSFHQREKVKIGRTI